MRLLLLLPLLPAIIRLPRGWVRGRSGASRTFKAFQRPTPIVSITSLFIDGIDDSSSISSTFFIYAAVAADYGPPHAIQEHLELVHEHI